MTQEQSVRWAGDDSPNASVVVKRSRLPIGISAKTTENDEDGLDSSSPTTSQYSRDPLMTGLCLQEKPLMKRNDEKTPRKDAVPTLSLTGQRSSGLLHKLKTLIAYKRPLSSPIDDKAASAPCVLSDVTPVTVVGTLPGTSTPTSASAPICKSGRSGNSSGSFRRNRLCLKRQRLILPDEATDDTQAKGKGHISPDHCDDDSLIASLDLDAFIAGARQKNAASGSGTPLNRRKTTGDLSDSLENAFFASIPLEAFMPPNAKPNVDDDDSFFASEDFLAEVDKLEQLCQTQRSKR